MSIDLIKENSLKLKKAKKQIISHRNYDRGKQILNKNIFILSGKRLELGKLFTYLGSNISSTESDVNIHLVKAWNAIDWLSIIWKFDLFDWTKRDFFPTVAVSILLCGCTTWMLTKRIGINIDVNYKKMLPVFLNKSLRQYRTKLQFYGHLLCISQTIYVWWTRYAEHDRRSKDELISDIFWWTLTDQQRIEYIGSVRTQDAAWMTSQERWMIARESWGTPYC